MKYFRPDIASHRLLITTLRLDPYLDFRSPLPQAATQHRPSAGSSNQSPSAIGMDLEEKETLAAGDSTGLVVVSTGFQSVSERLTAS